MPKQSKLTGAISLVIAQAVVLLLGFVTHPILSHLLGVGPYGIYGIILSIQTIVGLLLTLGVPSAISRFVAQNETHARSILSQALRIQVLVAAGLAVINALAAPFVARLLNDESLTPYLLFVSPVIFLQAFYPVYVQFFSGLHRFHRQALLTILYALAKLVGAIALIFFLGVYGAFAGFAIGGIIAAIIGWYWSKRVPKDKPLTLNVKTFLSFAGTYVLILVGLQILMSLDLFMVKAILENNEQAGYYNAAVMLSRISYLLLQALSFVILPSVSALTRPGVSHDKAAKFIKETLRYLIALIVPSITFAAATSEQLIKLFFPDSYAPVAAPVLTVLMVGLGCLAFYLLLINIVAGAGKGKFGLVMTIVLLAMSGALGSILIPRFGLMGAAWQTTITAAIGLIVLGAYTFKTFNIPVPVKSTINIGIATVVAVLPTYIWKPAPLLLPLEYIGLFALYVLVLFILGEVRKTDRQYLASLHPRLAWIAK